MLVELRLFAIARQRVGRPTLDLELPEPATVADLKRALVAAEPGIAALLPSLKFAVDSEYADDATPIRPGAELAAIPPVSGGGPDVAITDGPIDHAAVTERVRSPLAGAVCTFLGTTREITGERRTATLDYEAYGPMALTELGALEAEARRRWPLIDAAIVHRIGRVDPGEISVVVAVSSPHRRAAFEACQWIMDTLKERVPIWKRETWTDGGREWVHPGLDLPPS